MSDVNAVQYERTRCANIAAGLEQRWRESAARARQRYARAWVGGLCHLRNAEWIEAAADGLAAVRKLIESGAEPRT
jgi:hypothetical protein